MLVAPPIYHVNRARARAAKHLQFARALGGQDLIMEDDFERQFAEELQMVHEDEGKHTNVSL